MRATEIARADGAAVNLPLTVLSGPSAEPPLRHHSIAHSAHHQSTSVDDKDSTQTTNEVALADEELLAKLVGRKGSRL